MGKRQRSRKAKGREADRYLDEQAARFEPPAEPPHTAPCGARDQAMKAKALPGQTNVVRAAVRRGR